ncbi:hypothetical protein ZYGR_0AI03410, partial [Zygosaccharomyces rouxii]
MYVCMYMLFIRVPEWNSPPSTLYQTGREKEKKKK